MKGYWIPAICIGTVCAIGLVVAGVLMFQLAY